MIIQRDPRQREPKNTKMVPRQVQVQERREPKRSLEKPKPKEEIIEIKEEATIMPPKKQRNTKKKVIKLEEEETSVSLEETIKNLNHFIEEEGEIKEL